MARSSLRGLVVCSVVALVAGHSVGMPAAHAVEAGPAVSILVYHRLGPIAANEMTVRTSTLRWQLQYLKDHHYPIVPLHDLINYLRGAGAPPPPSAVVITVDDGHRSVYSDLLPLVREFHVPVTLFIYPSAISNASYALTWAQLGALRQTGLFDVQSHTYWHPNFKLERRRLSHDAFRDFSTTQLCKARAVLQQRTGAAPDLVAWPFGIHDDEVAQLAKGCGYVAAFTLGRHTVERGIDLMALPRFLVTDTAVGKAFAAMLPPQTAGH